MYKVFKIYDDMETICEDGGDDFCKVLNALAIYLADPSCIGVKVWRADNGEIIIDYWKD